VVYSWVLSTVDSWVLYLAIAMGTPITVKRVGDDELSVQDWSSCCLVLL
jgi:hypothetical protein